MKNLTLYEMIFQFVLLGLAVYHIFKKEIKIVKSIGVVLVISFLPACLSSIFQIFTDDFSRLTFAAVIFMSMYLGSSLKFYDKYRWWDRSLHFLSGASFLGFGMALAGSKMEITKAGLLLFGFTFSITMHVFWEVLEYLCDCITHSNAQRWQKIHDSHNHISTKAIQPAGLVDTMNDTICCICGSILAMLCWGWIL
ncbi:MAG: hypothetical protein ACRDBO_03725 [Lachnospiraceae bacterium]